MIAAVQWVGELLDGLVSGSVVSVRVSPDIREPSDWLAWRLIPEAFAGLCVPRHTQSGKCRAPVLDHQFSGKFCMSGHTQPSRKRGSVSDRQFSVVFCMW